MGLFKRQSYKPSKITGDYIFSNFSYGLYNLDTPRGLGEQLTSLALTGGRNVWTEKGALVSQYGYNIKGEFAEGDVPYLVSSDNSLANNIFILCLNGKVYYYTTLEGLKKYATTLDNIENPVIAHNGNNLYLTTEDTAYIFGGNYSEATPVAMLDRSVTASTQGDIVHFSITKEENDYFWIDKKVALGIAADTYVDMVVNSIQKLDDDEDYDYIVYLGFDDSATVQTITGSVDIYEKALHELNLGEFDNQEPPELVPLQEGFYEFTWVNEPGSQTIDIPDRILKPKLMAVALNRLWVVDYDNTIFYSAVGSMTNFEEAYGAGYFKGFYQDTSEVLSIEEYYSGVLITKQTGMYHVKLTTEKYSYAEGQITSGMDENYINIQKISNITQKYPGDHVVIGSEVIAFDSSSGNLVQAAYVNYLGGIQEGSVLLHGSELDSQSMGLQSANKRILAYSFQEEALLLYYGSLLDKALLITRGLSLFPRETNKNFLDVQMFAQGFINITVDGLVLEDFKRGTIIPELTPVAEFEPIGLRSNLMLSGTIMEFTELNGIRFEVSTINAGDSTQTLTPNIIQVDRETSLPNLIYSDESIDFRPTSFAQRTRWASQKSSVTRLAAPLGGRDGLAVRLEFEPNVSFCLSAIRFPDMSQGE